MYINYHNNVYKYVYKIEKVPHCNDNDDLE